MVYLLSSMGSLMANTDPVSIWNWAKEIKVYPRKTDMPVFLVLLLRSTHAAATPSENKIGKTSVFVLTFVMFMSFCRNIGIETYISPVIQTKRENQTEIWRLLMTKRLVFVPARSRFA